MKTTRLRSYTFSIFLFVTVTAQAQSSRAVFSGPYLGIDFGRQHLIGGSLVNGVDILQEDSRAVASFYAGLRVQFAGGFVIGGEAGIGKTDGDLALSNPAGQLQVDYSNHQQTYWGLQLGHTLDRDWLVFGYLAEVTRNFDVTIRQAQQTFKQTDEQGILRFGAGVDFKTKMPLLLRTTLGSARADFGNRVTNIDIKKKLEASIGVAWQF